MKKSNGPGKGTTLAGGYVFDDSISRHIVREEVTGYADRRYELPDKTPVKKQFLKNSWAYAATAMMESAILKKAVPPPSFPVDLSPLHMTYAMFDYSEEPGYHNPYGLKTHGGYGGSSLLAMAYMTRGILGGPVSYFCDPDPENATGGELPPRKLSLTMNKPRTVYRPSFKIFAEPRSFPDPDLILEIKLAVRDHSAVMIGMCREGAGDVFMAEDRSVIPYRYSFFSHVDMDGRNAHAVAIVGWDDDYPKELFRSMASGESRYHNPQADGAFKVKNSLGTVTDEKGTCIDDGYFWISYEDVNIGNAVCITDVIKFSDPNYQTVIQFDKFGLGGLCSTVAEPFMVKNRFVCDRGQGKIEAIGIYTPEECHVGITLQGKHIFSGLLPHAGYHLIQCKIDNKVNYPDIEVTYFNRTGKTFLLPVEYQRDKDIYSNVTVNPSKCLVNNEDILNIRRREGKAAEKDMKVSYVPIGLVYSSRDDAEISHILNRVESPTAIGGIIPDLPGSPYDLTLEWSLEPVGADTYGEFRTKAAFFTTTTPEGKVHRGIMPADPDRKETISVVGLLYLRELQVRKEYILECGPVATDYTFEYRSVRKGDNTTVLQGYFPMPGAKVHLEFNGSDARTVVDGNNCWQIETELYPAEEGFKEEYARTTITARFYSDANDLIQRGDITIEVPDPTDMEITSSGVTISITSLVGFYTALANLEKYPDRNIEIRVNETVTVPVNRTLALGEHVHLVAEGSAQLIFTGKVLPFLEKVGSCTGVGFIYRSDGKTGDRSEAVFVEKLSPNSMVRDCFGKFEL